MGLRSFFTPEGEESPMFLKTYTGLSCPKLLEQFQGILADKWRPYMENLDTMNTDATCYESGMRYPTDAKLMWEGVEKSYATMCGLSSRLGIHRPFGEKKKEKDLVRRELARVRATAMEGSFGTQKEHYDLRRVKARTKRMEILYIFFGIHTANVVQLADGIEQRSSLATA